MARNDLATKKADRSSVSQIAQSAWGWDLRLAFVVAGVIWIVYVRNDFEPDWTWVLPQVAISLGLSQRAATEKRDLVSRLSQSNYGTLIRLGDPSEFEVKLPYSIISNVAIISSAFAGLTTAIIQMVNGEIVEAALFAFSGFLTSWSLFGVL